ncbi:hypothetical protein Cni_G03437 [Canna indica]|uniref:Hydroxyproline-rich glycoprotein family protein n=1 Tax=Canna indica TaxID=4628 RepID=A0AAQ3Q3I8_9LILI|nr:hypothetical protein Cni_G03437 [Canna indica]
MQGFGKLAAARGRPTSATAYAAAAAYSALAGAGGGGRGRGRGSGPPPRVPGQSIPDGDDEDIFSPPGVGRGRGHPVLPSSPVLPSFSSWMSKPSAAGRGSGRFAPAPPDPSEQSDKSQVKEPIFFTREDVDVGPVDKPQFADADEVKRFPRTLSPGLTGAGRGKPPRPAEPDSRPREENRHLRQRPAPRPGSETSGQTTGQQKLGHEEAVKRAVEVLSRGGRGGGRGPGRGRGGRAMMRGRGRGGRSRGQGSEEAEEDMGIYLGDNADGEKLEKRLGEERMKRLNEAFEEMSSRALPSPQEDAYFEALHTNNMIEYEPEYLVDFDNPDIDEKPPMSLHEALEKAKPFLMAYEGIQSQEEWEEAVKEIMERLPYMKELMDMYCGPDRVTAKQQQEELERVAKTLPENIPSSVKRFTDQAVLSLQSNPGWGFDKKCQFMDKLVWEVSQHYK